MGKRTSVDIDKVSFNEEIKKLRTNLKFSAINGEVRVIGLTSSLPSEGKSRISASLALSFAQNDERVLLIDCDLRKGRQKQLFSIPDNSEGGVSKLLIAKDWEKEYRGFICDTKYDNLFVIPTGVYPPNPSELLSNERFALLMQKLRKEFDVIILDCPPLEGLSDALVISKYTDTMVLVAKFKSTPIKLVEKSKKSLETVGAKLAGIVLNQVEKEPNTYYYGYYSAES